MKLIIFYDLPTTSKANIAQHSKFRTNLLKMGFIQVQESIYMKHCFNHIILKKVISHVIDIAPKNGDIRALPITNKQYLEHMVIIRGNKSFAEIHLDDEDLIVI